MKYESFKKGFTKFIHTYRNNQYQQWKEHGYQIQIELTMRIYLAISIIFMIIKVSLMSNQYYDWIILGIGLFLHIVFFLSLKKSNIDSMFLEMIPLIQLQIISWICYKGSEHDQSYLIVLVTLTINFQSLYKSLYMKIISIILFTLWTTYMNLNSNEGLYLSLALLAIKIARQEWQLLQHFLNLQALFMIIDSIPQAMCIVNKSKNWLLYSNKVFENLAVKLESGNQPETESPGKSSHLSTNFTKAQLNFLQNLKLDELNSQGVSLIELEPDELQFDDQYKIKDVIYNKQGMTSTFNFENPSPSKKLEQQQRFFQAFKLNDEESVIKKTYTSDVTMRLELQHQQQIQSAIKKRFRKISMNQIKNVNIQTPSRKVSLDQYLLSERKSGQKQSLIDPELSQSRPVSSVINHKVKFLIHVMENYKMIESNDDDEFQIYFIHELNQVLLKSKLKKSENIKKNLLRSISHELLTNLNAVFGYIKQSQDRMLKKQSCEKELDLALKYTKLQLYKINDFFDYRDILEDRFDMKKDKFEINSAIWECVDLLKDQIERKQLKIDVDLPEISYIILGDRQRLCQVLLNLIGNAIRFTFKGGISIIVQKKKYNDSMIGVLDDVQSNFLQEEMNMIEVWVNDTGIGMNEESLCTLRKKLHVADEDEKISKQSVGQGLGLQVCKSIIKLLSPQAQILSVDSREGEGTQFYFSLRYIEENFPAFEKQSYQTSVPQVDAESTQQVKVLTYNKPNYQQIISPCDCKTILIVDDEQFNIDILSHIIKNLGYDVDTALNGKQALDKVSLKLEYRCSPECIGYKCILMDINMPIMSGWEAVQRIRQLENLNQMTKTTPIIAITAFCSIQDQQKSINEGFNCVMIKPATKEAMLNTFQKLNI